ncbi:kynurenine/alpha-aminoadipate aminotransferase, mitochondrial-like [Athalia rosae]|uniref:kynurenine/alpha-aminoadipate aminotransferase, mitochondrial-like n=1 Tax=Athalia rosae TaxID=37344 RepID=UPI0006268D4F|nr:kynurenine/alpha-aminoadipate aminotransferase, mitochondrial-like [Athalia rosae]
MDYSLFISDVSKRRRSAPTREITKIAYSAAGKLISLAEGMPNEETFPITEINLKLLDGLNITLKGDELGAALQYIPSQGFPPLLETIRDLQKKLHSPPLWEMREIVIVAGGQDGLSKALEAIVEPEDPVLVQDPFYAGAEVVLAPHKVELLPVAQDEFGMVPSILRDVLEGRRLLGKKMPKIMYINPTGANPTGTVLPIERRKEIYRIACEYDFIILDDDPYHHMYFTDEAPKSFLSLDTEGRVIRLDSFSKVLSSGLRLGFITAASPLVASIELHMQSSHLHASTLSQVIAYKLLKIWGHEGLMNHFKRIRGFYKQRRDVMAGLAKKHLHGLAEFAVPGAGFFLWIKVKGVSDTWRMVMQRGVTHGVLFVPGAGFTADPERPCNAIRASFAKATYDEMNQALERLAKMIREELAAAGNCPVIQNGNT